MKAQNPYLFIGNILFGKWKMILLRDMACYNYIRFNKTLRFLPISKKVLSEQLKQLTKNGLVQRKQYDGLPLRVEYSLTGPGEELVEISDELFIWAVRDMYNKGVEIDRDAMAVHSCDKFKEALKDIIPLIQGYEKIIDSKNNSKIGSDGSGTLSNPYLYLGSIISGKWKMSLLHKIDHDGYLRFSDTLREFGMSEKVLAQQLKQLTDDGLIYRKQYDTIPLTVKYFLTERGKALMPAIDKIYIWVIKFMFDNDYPIDPNAFIVHTDNKYEKELFDIINQIPAYKKAVEKANLKSIIDEEL